MPLANWLALLVSLTPEALELIDSIINLFDGKTVEEQAVILEELKNSLQPMIPKQ